MTLAPEACPRCGEPVRWAETVGGLPFPVDPEPVATGTVLLHQVEGHDSELVVRLSAGELHEARRGRLSLYRPHLSSCAMRRTAPPGPRPTPENEDYRD